MPYKMPIKCRIWWDEQAQAYVVSSNFNDKFIEAIKGLIPSGDRNYDPNTKFWYVKETYGAFIHTLSQNAFGISSVSFVSKQAAEQSSQTKAQSSRSSGAYLNPSQGGTTEDAIIAFFTLVPYDAARKCYLLAAASLHPDKPSGDGIKMSKLNELWTRLEKELFKR